MTALITGASAGIGFEFSKLLASEGHNLVLVARNYERLENAKREIEQTFPGVQCEVMSADLSIKDDIERVARRLQDEHRPVDVLINNAGLGLNQSFSTGDVSREQYLVDVLVSAVMQLTHAAVSSMRTRGSGDVVIVSSVASFVALGTYSAAKAWNTVFAESLSQELRGTGVRISALCPGFTHTEFHQRAEISKKEIPSWMWLDASKMVAAGWRDHNNGKVISVPSLRYKVLVLITKIIPRFIVRSVGFKSRNKTRK